MYAFLIDAIVVAIFLITVAIFTYRGLAKSAMGFLIIVASFLVCKIFGGAVSGWVDETFIYQPVLSLIDGILSKSLGEAANSVNGEEFFASLPEALKGLLEFAGADIASLEEYAATFGDNVSASLSALAAKIAAPISAAISTFIAYIGLFLVSLVVFKLVSLLIVKLMELPVLDKINRIGGLIAGVFAGFIICKILCSLYSLIIGIIAISSSSLDGLADLSETYIFSFFAGK